MKRTAFFALAAVLGSTVFANAITVTQQNGPSGVQLVQDKMKNEKMTKEEKMKHDEKMKKDSMMKDGMKKDEMKK